MIERTAHNTLLDLSRQFKAVGIVEPRQSGKTTLAKHSFPGKPYASLENYFLKLSGQSEAAVVYGGESRQDRSTGIKMLPWNKINQLPALDG